MEMKCKVVYVGPISGCGCILSNKKALVTQPRTERPDTYWIDLVLGVGVSAPESYSTRENQTQK